MTDNPPIDESAAHKHYSEACFNAAWDLLDKHNRTPDESEQMLRLSQASHWHWSQRPDYGPTQRSVAYWQTSRVSSVLGRAADAAHYGQLSLEAAQEQGVEPFYSAYANEALARAAHVGGDTAARDRHLAEARRIGESLDEDLRSMLLNDLATIA